MVKRLYCTCVSQEVICSKEKVLHDWPGSDWAEEQQQARVLTLTLHLSPDTRLVDILTSPPVANASIGADSIYTAAEFTCNPP